MFDSKIKELFYFQTSKKWKDNNVIINVKRHNAVKYDFNHITYTLLPLDVPVTTKYAETLDRTRVMFINESDIQSFEDDQIRILTLEDKETFMEFKNACPKADFEEGMVCIEDSKVAGAFRDGKIVCVSSTWNWGEKLADIGVLTHPDYRHQNLALKTCSYLMNHEDKAFVWRCDEKNNGSYKLAKKLGFQDSGVIIELKKAE